ncbi:hypothetical protein BGZ50_003480 [Haplosporangium sp. Z 11]|nr:hypothetical protein BGZ50_003480 [Haplosporangium sp. Z 11]
MIEKTASYLGLVPFVLAFTGRAWRLITRFDRNQAIYYSRFAEPADLEALSTQHPYPTSAHSTKETVLISASSLSYTPSSDDPSFSESQRNTTLAHARPGMSEQEKVIELIHQSPKEIALSKKWYNRYRRATDRQVSYAGFAFMALNVLMAVYFQLTTTSLAFDPLVYECHISPFMIFQLKGINDGFGIRNELIFLSLFSVPCVVLFFLMPAVVPEFTRKILDKTSYMAFILIAGHIPSILMPLAQHFINHPNHCTCTDFFRQKPHNQAAPATVANIGSLGRKDAAKVTDNGDMRWSGPEDIPMEGTAQGASGDVARQTNEPPLSRNSTPLPVAKYSVSRNGRVQDQAASSEGHSMSQHQRNNSVSNLNTTFKSLIRNQKRRRFGINSNGQKNVKISCKKTDWDEFINALEDQRLFDRINAFTVREFCAENTRFLYEVSRLERRAVQYERLRNLTAASQGTAEDLSSSQSHMDDNNATGSSTSHPQRIALTKSPSTGTSHSTLPPLPGHFPNHSSSTTNMPSSGPTPHRIKKIVSASSVSSTVPMLTTHRSSSSIFDESEPSSPLGSGSNSMFQRYGPSTSALPNLEEGVMEQPTKGDAALGTAQSDPDPLSVPIPTTFAPLPMPPTLLIQFKYIYKTFIAHGGRLELNLSYETAQEIHQAAKRDEWRSGMFDGAIYEIQELLFRDVWPKFVTSSNGLGDINCGSQSDGGHLQEAGATSTSRRTSTFIPFEPHSTASSRPSPSPSIMMTTPKSSVSRTTSSRATVATVSEQNPSRSGSVHSFRTQSRKEDVTNEMPMRSGSGLKSWIAKSGRTGYTTAALISREGPSEESIGIIEQSRKSMVDRRSDTSGLYSTSHSGP